MSEPKDDLVERISDLPPGDDLNWPEGNQFTFLDAGGHNPCYVVMPDGAAIPLNHWNNQGTDIARAKWIIDACNAKWPDCAPQSDGDMMDMARDFRCPSCNYKPRLPDLLADRIEAQAKLIEGLRGYAQHYLDCYADDGCVCNCGLDTLLASIKEPT